MKKDIELLEKAREQRVMDAIRLKVPDRVPVISPIGYFPAKYTGIDCTAAWYDFNTWLKAYQTTLRDFHPDMIHMQGYTSGKALEILKPRGTRWPGWGCSPNHSHQAIELEIMKANEYDVFLDDPGDYLFRVNLARSCEELAGLENLPKLQDLGFSMFGAPAVAEVLVQPEAARAIKALQKAGREFVKSQAQIAKFNRMIESFGIPSYYQGSALTPFDAVSHSMRGMRGTIMDMYRQPDKLLEACDKLLDMTLKKPIPAPNKYGNTRIFMPLTRGSDDFMSLKHFEKFYWPTLKKLVLKLIERGMTPVIFFEGNFVTRLEYLLDFPKGRVLAHLDTTDIFKAKEILKDHMCIKGNIPASILQVGSVQDVEAYCKKLIDVVGKGGGFILSPRGSTDEVKTENLKAMIEFTQKYGVYDK
jgi:uroporphyrinogen-III decarboxylase